jgi:hypothetical protein
MENSYKARLSCNACFWRPAALATTCPCMHGLEMLPHTSKTLFATCVGMLSTEAAGDAIMKGAQV